MAGGKDKGVQAEEGGGKGEVCAGVPFKQDNPVYFLDVNAWQNIFSNSSLVSRQGTASLLFGPSTPATIRPDNDKYYNKTGYVLAYPIKRSTLCSGLARCYYKDK